jgi:two-component system response regulator RegX3
MISKRNINILVVDDQENWREALTILLTEEGYKIKAAEYFEDAIRELEQKKFDLIVLDVRLVDPDIFNVQGVELLKIIKNQENAPKVVMLTGYPESVRDGILSEYGADALILKVPPNSKFDSQAFREKIQSLLI